jgi:hypothetical protein
MEGHIEGNGGETTLNEREMQSGEGETAICHVCDQRFPTQGELLKHLEETTQTICCQTRLRLIRTDQEAIDGPDQDA